MPPPGRRHANATVFNSGAGAVNTGTETISVGGSSDLVTGDYVTYSKGVSGNSAIGGLEDNRNYFDRRTGNLIKLCRYQGPCGGYRSRDGPRS